MAATGGTPPTAGGATGVGGTTGGTPPMTGGSAGVGAGAAGGVGGVGGVGGSAGVPATGGSAGLPVMTGGSAGVPATGGTAGVPATGGTAGVPATGGSAGMDPAAGAGGSAGTGTPSSMPCPAGCAELSVPFTAYKAAQYFEIYLDADTDMSAAVITVKARKVAGKAGGLMIVVKNGSAQSYAYAQSMWNSINDMTTEFTSYTLDVAMPSSTSTSATFAASAVKIISVQIAAGDPWYADEAMTMEDPTALLNPTVVQIDEISIAGTGTLPGPYTFATDAMILKANVAADALAAVPPYAVSGSAVTWVGP